MRNATVGSAMWKEKKKKKGNWETHTVGREYGEKHGKCEKWGITILGTSI